VDAISFTGSVGTGRAIGVRCAELGKKFQLEMGGKNPMVVLDDADLSVAVEACVNSAFFSTGQRCTASSRLIVTSSIHDAFVEAVKARLKGIRVGHAMDPATHIGPVVDERQLNKDMEYIRIGVQEGAQLFGGERLTRPTDGFYLEPALLYETEPGMRINTEEIFGPVASVIRAKDYEEALAIANATEFGLSAGICTQSLKFATHFKRSAQAGMVMVNLPTAGVDYHVPFGGTKASSHGSREQGSYSREFYTTVKTSYTLA
jgi:aldehyde dehydrogenase (NAD+)